MRAASPLLSRASLGAAMLAALAFAACRVPKAVPRQGGASGAAAQPAQSSDPVILSSTATVQELLAGIELAYRRGRYEDGLTLVKRALETGRKDISVVDRVGSIYYLLGRYGEALALWEQALRLEKNRRRREDLERSISLARLSLGIPSPKTGEPEKPKPPRPRPAAAAKAPPDPKLVEKLYDQGVAHYAKGEYLQAASAFMQVLELDPEHALARSALARLKLKPAAEAGKDGNPG